MEMEYELFFEKMLQKLIDEKLLLIDIGEALKTAKLEIHRKKKNNGDKVTLFIIRPS